MTASNPTAAAAGTRKIPRARRTGCVERLLSDGFDPVIWKPAKNSGSRAAVYNIAPSNACVVVSSRCRQNATCTV